MQKRTVTISPDRQSEGQRLDVWLYRVRLFKTRSLATKTILKGKIRVTRCGQTDHVNKPHIKLRPGDRAVFMRGETLFHVEMIDTAKRRGPAKEAQTLYRVLPMSLEGDSHEF